MNLVRTIGKLRKHGARRVLGALLLVWLNMALQPCAMALGSDTGHECPHCPPSIGQHQQPCDLESADDCAFIDELNYDGRIPKLKFEDGTNDVPMVRETAPVALIATRKAFRPTGAAPPRHRTGPPLNIRFCVFLN